MNSAATPCIFVTGIWKSGNHLAYSALNELGIPGPFNGISGHLLFGRHAWLKKLMRRPRDPEDAIQVGLETDVHVSRRYIERQARKLTGCILGGHAAYSDELRDVLRSNHVRAICIRRDPRDILVSFADWIGSRPDFYLYKDFVGLSRNARIEKLLRGGKGTGYLLTPFPEVLERAQGWLTQPEILQISFEGLIGADGGGDADTQFDLISKLHAHANARKPMSEVDPTRIYGGTLTFNKGRSQRWRDLESHELVAEIERTLSKHLDNWGYVS